MKLTIRIFCFLTLIFGASACQKDTFSDTTTGIWIRFVNQTGLDIQAAKANEVIIGDIANQASTDLLRFDSFTEDSGMPDCRFTGVQNGDTLQDRSIFYWCGTQKKNLEDGKYTIVIKVDTIRNERYFHLRFGKIQ
jgi:hypothetical protein